MSSGTSPPFPLMSAARLLRLYADDNMIVAAGAPLAQLDPVPFQLEVDRVLADLRNAQAEVRTAAVNVRLVRQDRRALLDGASARRGEAERAARAAEVEVQTRGQIHRKEQELLASQRAQVPGLAAIEENARLYYERFSRLAASGDVPVQDRDNRAATYREAIGQARVAAQRHRRRRAPGARQRTSARGGPRPARAEPPGPEQHRRRGGPGPGGPVAAGHRHGTTRGPRRVGSIRARRRSAPRSSI